MTHLRLGDSLDKGIDMGAIVDESQKKTIDGYVQKAKEEGAEVKKKLFLFYFIYFYFKFFYYYMCLCNNDNTCFSGLSSLCLYS